MKDLIVVGGGACGLIAALSALRNGLSVLLIEKMDRVGKKLLATGNGRCNLANRDFGMSFYHGSCLEKARTVFDEYGPDEIEAFWKSLGIIYREEENGRCYPRSLQASSVLNVLRRDLETYERGGSLTLVTNARVTDVRLDKRTSFYEVTAVEQTEAGKSTHKYKGHQVALVTGGKASPRFGSDGEGYVIAEKLGLDVTPVRPGICRLLSDDPVTKRLSGQRIETAVSLICDDRTVAGVHDELLFTDDGLSGPASLSLSRTAGDLLGEGKSLKVTLDLAEEYLDGELFAFLLERTNELRETDLAGMLEGWLPKRVIPEVIRQAGLASKDRTGSLTKRQIRSLSDALKGFSIPVSGIDDFRDAQVTVGGVKASSLGEGLEADGLPGLFLAGELLDLDGDCGGYNLMFAAACGLYIGSHAGAFGDPS